MFYDASYIATSEKINAKLVTADDELLEKAKKYISVMIYAELERSI